MSIVDIGKVIQIQKKERILLALEGCGGHARETIKGLTFQFEGWILIETANIY